VGSVLGQVGAVQLGAPIADLQDAHRGGVNLQALHQVERHTEVMDQGRPDGVGKGSTQKGVNP
jgi:hypothetical protein